jgi:hypothetical protein
MNHWIDMGVVRGVLTLALFSAFAVLVVRTWSRKRAPDFEIAARMPLDEDRHVGGDV